jgi:hypothetical protein
MKDPLDLEFEWRGDVMHHEPKAAIVHQVRDIRPGPRRQIVQRDHLMPVFQQTLAGMRTQKSRSSRYQDRLH